MLVSGQLIRKCHFFQEGMDLSQGAQFDKQNIGWSQPRLTLVLNPCAGQKLHGHYHRAPLDQNLVNYHCQLRREPGVFIREQEGTWTSGGATGVTEAEGCGVWGWLSLHPSALLCHLRLVPVPDSTAAQRRACQVRTVSVASPTHSGALLGSGYGRKQDALKLKRDAPVRVCFGKQGLSAMTFNPEN